MASRCVIMLALSAAVLGLSGLSPRSVVAANPTVTIVENSASIDTFQALNSTVTRTREKDGSNFVRFPESLKPPALAGVEGKADVFVLQASTMVTPSSRAFPTGPLNGIGLSGRVSEKATKKNNAAAGVPVANSEGSMSVLFQTSAPTPAFFDGSLLAANDDTDNCTHISVNLTGPNNFSRIFSADKGRSCPSAGPRQKGFAQTDVLQPGAYTLSVDYQAEVDPEQPGTLTAFGAVEVDLEFFPPTARFNKSLSGSKVMFDGGASSAPSGGGPITRWEWTFGDGKTASTPSPRVTHVYPLAVAGPIVYKASLQVVDIHGGKSGPTTQTILGTATLFTITKRQSTLGVAGSVKPNLHGQRVTVTLRRKKGGIFKTIAIKVPSLSSSSRFSTSFGRPPTGFCSVDVRYEGDTNHLASQLLKKFAC